MKCATMAVCAYRDKIRSGLQGAPRRVGHPSIIFTIKIIFLDEIQSPRLFRGRRGRRPVRVVHNASENCFGACQEYQTVVFHGSREKSSRFESGTPEFCTTCPTQNCVIIMIIINTGWGRLCFTEPLSYPTSYLMILRLKSPAHVG